MLIKCKSILLVSSIILGFNGYAYADGFSMPAPIKFDAGPLGELDVQGVLSGMGFAQTNPSGSSLNGKNFGATITNGLITISKTTGLIQFNLTAGAYNYPTLGEPFASASSTTDDFGALPEAYVTIAPTNNFSLSIGQLPTLIGYTYGFTYQRMNIEGGFPWYLQPSFSRGIQLNYTKGPLSASVSWNDGYYSNRYNVLSGSVSYAINPENSITVYGMGNAGHTGNINYTNRYSANGYVDSELALDNSEIYGLYYTYSGKNFTITPEVQYVNTPASVAFGTTENSNNISAMIHGAYYLTPYWSIAAGVDYEHSSKKRTPGDSYYFGYGPGSSALGLMITPTYTFNGYFIRDELSYVRLTNYTTGFGDNNSPDQIRDILETGFWF